MTRRVVALVALIFGFFYWPVHSARLFDRRSDLAELPPAMLSGLAVPLQGGQVCENDECIDILSPPASNKRLEVVAIARGSFNYSCEDAGPANAPVSLEQFTQLYNVSTFLTLFNQEYLQELVQQLYDYDYGEGKNNTLDCIGTIGTLNGSAVVTLYEIDTFDAHVLETIPSPDDPDNNGLWAHSRSKSDFDWEMYRVEMVGGKVPAICAGQPDSFDVQYAAQYWFYHS